MRSEEPPAYGDTKQDLCVKQTAQSPLTWYPMPLAIGAPSALNLLRLSQQHPSSKAYRCIHPILFRPKPGTEQHARDPGLDL